VIQEGFTEPESGFRFRYPHQMDFFTQSGSDLTIHLNPESSNRTIHSDISLL